MPFRGTIKPGHNVSNMHVYSRLKSVAAKCLPQAFLLVANAIEDHMFSIHVSLWLTQLSVFYVPYSWSQVWHFTTP